MARHRSDRRWLPAPGWARWRRWDRERSPGRLQQLGRGAVEECNRGRPSRQRPPPRHFDAVGLVHERAPLSEGDERLPVRRRRRLVPGSSRHHPRPQRASRLGRDEHRSRRPGSVRGGARPGQPRQLRVPGRVRPVRGPQGDDQGRRRRRRGDRGPQDPPRPDPQRRRQAPCGRPAAGARVDGDGGRRRHVRGDLPTQHRRDVRGVPGGVLHLRLARPELRLCRRRRAHRLCLPGRCSDPGGSRRSRRSRPIRERRQPRMDGSNPLRRDAVAARSAKRRHRDREQRRGRRQVPVLRRGGVGSRLPGETDHRSCWRTSLAAG